MLTQQHGYQYNTDLKKNKVLWKVFSPKEALLNDLMFQGLMLIQVAYSQAHYQLVANPI
eukprot:CCRYP_016966-RA/>CCRYP_016966-RA protein AED:0.32 eAED:0.43 QI:600/0/0.5/1/0/0/4/0/58